MNKSDIIKTYIFEPHYYEYEKPNIYCEFLKIFNNNYILYIHIHIYNLTYLKTKQIKDNYVISYVNHYKTRNIITKVKNYDNTKIDIRHNIFYNNNIYNYDISITNNFITKKIIKKLTKNIYIIYKKNIIKDG